MTDLHTFLEQTLALVPEPAHSGTWRTYFHQSVSWHPATSTRVLKVITDALGQPLKIQLCASSDNNHSVLIDLPDDLDQLRPMVQREIELIARRKQAPSSPQIRQATQADAPAIAELHARSWRQAYRGMLSDDYLDGDILGDRLAVWRSRLDAPPMGQHVVVAEAQGQVIALACAYGAHHPVRGTLLENLHVDRRHQRQGLGAALVRHVRHWNGQNHPGQGLHLWVLAPNTAAQRFYASLNAVQMASDHWAAPDGRSIAQLCLAWPASVV